MTALGCNFEQSRQAVESILAAKDRFPPRVCKLGKTKVPDGPFPRAFALSERSKSEEPKIAEELNQAESMALLTSITTQLDSKDLNVVVEALKTLARFRDFRSLTKDNVTALAQLCSKQLDQVLQTQLKTKLLADERSKEDLDLLQDFIDYDCSILHDLITLGLSKVTLKLSNEQMSDLFRSAFHYYVINWYFTVDSTRNFPLMLFRANHLYYQIIKNTDGILALTLRIIKEINFKYNVYQSALIKVLNDIFTHVHKLKDGSQENHHLSEAIFEINVIFEMFHSQPFDIRLNYELVKPLRRFVDKLFEKSGNAAWRYFDLVDNELQKTKCDSNSLALYAYISHRGYTRQNNSKALKPRNNGNTSQTSSAQSDKADATAKATGEASSKHSEKKEATVDTPSAQPEKKDNTF